jgi:glutamyl-tRNA synthetase
MANKKVITRFAPSPTGYLHIGNARTALISYLYALKCDGNFVLRIDDTDVARSSDEYTSSIIKDLEWMGIEVNQIFHQSHRKVRYHEVKRKLISEGIIYDCYETPQELQDRRKALLSRGLPPIYDRVSALSLSSAEKQVLKDQGRKPCYRFKIKHEPIQWKDLIKGDISYEGKNLSDPIVFRSDDSPSYLLCSVIDDVDYNITHIFRGEDHISNTAIQIQMFDALIEYSSKGEVSSSIRECGSTIPVFGHLSLVKTSEGKVSKRVGGFEVSKIGDEMHVEPMAFNSLLASLGTSVSKLRLSMKELTMGDFYGDKSGNVVFSYQSLFAMNKQFVSKMDFGQIISRFPNMNEMEWEVIRHNVSSLNEVLNCLEVLHKTPEQNKDLVKDLCEEEVLKSAIKHIPQSSFFDEVSMKSWIKDIQENSGHKGKKLFMTIRIAITGKEDGPEVKKILLLLSIEEIKKRITLAYKAHQS